MVGVVAVLVAAAAGLLPRPVDLTLVLDVLVGVVTVLYVAVITYKSYLVMLAVRRGRRAAASIPRQRLVPYEDLPRYTVLVPVHKEGAVLAQLLGNLDSLDYPRDRLEVLLLVEADDEETAEVLDRIELPTSFQRINVPVSYPRTKPKACNVGLEYATGDFCVIYDAEDRPEADQLRKSVEAFSRASRNIVCMQAQLQYWNPDTNGLTRLFAAEYACNFSLVLPGLTDLRVPVPLGGTSNHFRTKELRELGGWDSYNVTEDADLGICLARAGLRVEMIDSVTWEEANSELGNWIRQRSRWIKGYAQTYLVHTRSLPQLYRQLGPRSFASFQLVVGGTPFTLLVNPLFWGLTIAYLATRWTGISALFPPVIFYLGLASMVIGNYLVMLQFAIGCVQRGLYANVRWLLFSFAYWALMSVAAYKAIGQLLNPAKQHYWEKTTHGLVIEQPTEGAISVAASGQRDPAAD
jgi:cellulose synthase/poly-beta-1,6-N-acetylglucosamine synthase-like glycosyltransferase